MHHTTPGEIETPKPTDPPFLFAILIGAMRTGDTMMQSLAREWLADIGVKVRVAKNAPVLTNHNKVLANAR